MHMRKSSSKVTSPSESDSYPLGRAISDSLSRGGAEAMASLGRANGMIFERAQVAPDMINAA